MYNLLEINSIIAENFSLCMVPLYCCHQIALGVVAPHSHIAQGCHHEPETVGGHSLLPVFKKQPL